MHRLMLLTSTALQELQKQAETKEMMDQLEGRLEELHEDWMGDLLAIRGGWVGGWVVGG